MNTPIKFYDLAEAVEFLGMPGHAVIRLILDGDLPVCFDADETLTGVTIQPPSGAIEHIAQPVPLSGVLSCHGDSAVDGALEAVGVRVLKVRSITCSRNSDGVLTKGCKLPTISESNGCIKPEYRVTGFVDFVRVEMANWRFHRDDLQAVKDEAVSGTAENSATAETPPERKQRIVKYVNAAHTEKRTKKIAFAELAKIDSCGTENIERIYYGKDAIARKNKER